MDALRLRHVTVNFLRFAGGLGEAGLLRYTCLVENAAHLRRHRLAQDATLEIVLVGDVDGLSPGVRAQLDTPPCRLHCAQAPYERLIARFPRLLAAFGGPYQVLGFAFLRWLLIAELFPDEPVLCYDGDVIHNVPLAELGRGFAGRTTTATSTCFAAVSDPQWFRQWERHVVALDADVDGFVARRAGALAAAGCDFRTNPEELFAKLLIEAGELPQDPLPEDFPWWIVPQPQLLPRLYSAVRTRGTPAAVPAPMRYARRGGTDLLNGRPVAFWHMQKPFLNQLSCLMIFRELRPELHPGRIPVLSFYDKVPTAALMRAIDPYFDEAGFPFPAAEQRELMGAMQRAERRNLRDDVALTSNPFSAALVYRYYFMRHDLGLLLNEATWPVPGMWA